MVWAPVAWAYKQVVTSAKLAQMVDNLIAHDHRADGTQGAPLRGPWVNASGLTAAAGWAITGTPRYRLIAGGDVIAIDLVVTRTGAELRGNDLTQNIPGNITDSTVLSGWPVEARPASGKDQPLTGAVGYTNPGTVWVKADGTISLVFLSAGAPVQTNDALTLRGFLWTG